MTGPFTYRRAVAADLPVLVALPAG